MDQIKEDVAELGKSIVGLAQKIEELTMLVDTYESELNQILLDSTEIVDPEKLRRLLHTLARNR